MTGWKSVFVNKGFTRRILGVTKDESDLLLQYLFNVSRIRSSHIYDPADMKQLLTQNHDAQVRFKWRKNDLAIWDNRSTGHCAT